MRRFSSLVLLLVLLCSASGASAQFLQPNRPAHLIGIRKVSVWVSLHDSTPAALKKERLRQLGEEQIRRAGLQVVPVPVQGGTEGSVFVELGVVVADIRSATQRFGFSFWASVRLLAGNSTVLWERGQLNICEEAELQRAVEAATTALLAELLGDWGRANPRL